MTTLSERMEFEHVIEIHTDGSITDAPANLYAPELYGEDDRLETPHGQDWELCTHGYTGQYGYNGPVLHNSESIGGRLERDILARPGYYVAIVCNWLPDESLGQTADDDTVEGWAIAFLPSAETPDET